MSFVLEAVRDQPAALFMMDDSSPFQDYSGYNKTGTPVSGTPTTSVPLASGAVYSTVFHRNCIGQFDNVVFKQGNESKPFSLESFVYPIRRTTGLTAQPYRENLIINPSFEVNITGWSENSGQPVSRITNDSLVGSSCIQTTHTPGGSLNLKASSVSALPGDSFSGSARVKWVGSTPKSIQPRLRFTLADSSFSDQFGTVATPSNSAWSVLSWTNVVAPANAVSLQIWFGASSVVAGEGFKLDAALLEKSPTLNSYFDGSFPGYEWSGTVHGSVSRTLKDVSRINVLTNPSAEGDLAHWGFNTGGSATGGVARDSTRAYSGTYSVKATTTSSTGGYAGVKYDITGLRPNTTYTFSGYAYIPASIAVPIKAIQTVNGLTVGTSTGATKDAWTRVSITFDSGVNTTGSVYVITDSGVNPGINSSFWVDALMLEEGSTVSPYFDGYSPGAGWSGTQDNSASYMYVSDGEQQILGNNNQMDGLTVNGTVVSFVTKYTDGSEARASYDLKTNRAAHLVGIHTPSKNSLYVDGEMVADVDISQAQKALSFVTTNGNLYTGNSSTGNAVAVNGIAQYSGALSQESVISHFNEARRVANSAKVVDSFGGNVISLTSVAGNQFLNQTWDTSDDWALGFANNVSISGDALIPQSDGTLSQAGTWVGSVQLGMANATSIYGATVTWEGQGVTVQASVDGTTWSTVTKGVGLSVLPPGYNPTDKTLLLKISFPGGIANDPSYLSSLNVVGLLSATGVNTIGRTVTFNSSYPREDHHQLEFSDMWGAKITNGGSISISADTTAEGLNPRTVEVWVRPDTSTLTFNISGTTYQNGVPATIIARAGEWTLIHITSATDITGPITISGAAEVGQIAFYTRTLTASEVAAVYSAYTASNAYRASDTSVITLTQSSDAATIYAHDWAILGAG